MEIKIYEIIEMVCLDELVAVSVKIKKFLKERELSYINYIV